MPSSIRTGVRRLLRLPLQTAAQIDSDADAELQAFLSERIEHLVAGGMPVPEAREEALRRLGSPLPDVTRQLHLSARTRERRMSMREMFDDFTHDLRYASRTLRRDLRFAVFATVLVGLGIGASVTVFSVANALLIRPLPFRDPEQLVWIPNGTTGGLSGQTAQVMHAVDFAGQNKSFTDVAAYYAFYGVSNTKLSGQSQSMRVSAMPVTRNFFSVLGVAPLLGRQFTAQEAGDNGPRAVMLSYPLWLRRFNADSSIIGKAITLNDEAVTVVAVLPSSFDFGSVFAPGSHFDLFIPFPMTESTNRQGNTIALVGRLKPGVTLAASALETVAIGKRLTEQHPERNEFTPLVLSLREHVSGHARPALIVLSLAVGVVMLIVCANLSNLLLARGTTRQKEMAVRVALGAGRQRLVRQLLTESIVLSCCGAAIGLTLAFAGTYTIAGLTSVSLPLLENVAVDGSAVTVALLLAVGAGLCFGMVPALQIPSSAVHSALKDSSRSATGGKRGGWTRNALVVSEIALSCVLLVGAGLLMRSFVKVLDVDMGFNPQRVASLRVDPPRASLSSQEKINAYVSEMLRHTLSIPGVQSAALSDGLPLGSNRTWGIRARGAVYERGKQPFSFIRVVSDGYIRTLGMRLIAGRDFTSADDERSAKVVIVNETEARVLWPGQSAIGKFVNSDTMRMVVGVVADVRHLALEQASGLETYLPIRQSSDLSSVQLVVRTTLAPSVFASSIRSALRTVSPDLPTNEFRTLQETVDNSVSPRRFTMLLLGGFAGFAVVLALLGIYGMISYTVNHRTQEIGVRMALGASALQLQGSIMRETLMLAAVGMTIGTVASWMLARTLGGFLFGITATDPATFFTVLGVLTVVATVGGYVPARRASRIDPIAALRAA